MKPAALVRRRAQTAPPRIAVFSDSTVPDTTVPLIPFDVFLVIDH
jgi:hypothetical protein